MTHDKPSKKVGAQVSEPREFYISPGESWDSDDIRVPRGTKDAMTLEVYQGEENKYIHVIEKSAYDELEAKLDLAVEALILAHEYHRKMLEDMYGADISVTQPHTFMENRLREVITKLKGGAK